MKFSDHTEKTIINPEKKNKIEQALTNACHDLPIVLLYIHGSYAVNTQSPLSDIDLAVLITPGLAMDREKRFDVISGLEQACGRDDLDIVIMNTAGPIIKDRVIRKGKLLYAVSEKERISFEASVIMKSMDFKHFSREYDNALFNQLKKGKFLD